MNPKCVIMVFQNCFFHTDKLVPRYDSDLADPDVEIIYVSPFPLSDEVEEYYAKLLEVGGVEVGLHKL